MNEKLHDILDMVQRTAVQVGDTAADMAYSVGKKTEELLSVAKLNIRIVDLKAEVNTSMREVGEMLYATHTGTPTDSDILQAKLEEIDGLKTQIAELEAQIGKEREAHTCATCGAATRDGDDFCRECGGKL